MIGEKCTCFYIFSIKSMNMTILFRSACLGWGSCTYPIERSCGICSGVGGLVCVVACCSTMDGSSV